MGSDGCRFATTSCLLCVTCIYWTPNFPEPISFLRYTCNISSSLVFFRDLEICQCNFLGICFGVDYWTCLFDVFHSISLNPRAGKLDFIMLRRISIFFFIIDKFVVFASKYSFMKQTISLLYVSCMQCKGFSIDILLKRRISREKCLKVLPRSFCVHGK